MLFWFTFFKLNVVSFFYMEKRICKAVRKVPVRCKNQKTFRVCVQPSNRVNFLQRIFFCIVKIFLRNKAVDRFVKPSSFVEQMVPDFLFIIRYISGARFFLIPSMESSSVAKFNRIRFQELLCRLRIHCASAKACALFCVC